MKQGTTDAPELPADKFAEIQRTLGNAAAHCDIDRLAGRAWTCECVDCQATRSLWKRRTSFISGEPKSPTADQIARVLREPIPADLIARDVAKILEQAGFTRPSAEFTDGLQIGFRLAQLMREDDDADPEDDALRR
jgi:hypothetical protein